MSKEKSIRRRRQVDWQKVIQQWQKSGLSVRTFCRQEGIPVTSFYHGRRRLTASASTTHRQNPQNKFVEVNLRSPSTDSASLEIIWSQPADMRRSFDRLALMVREIIRQDPLSGQLFVFRNRKGDRVKLLYWDQDGFAIWYKRLEKGIFHWPEGVFPDGRLERRELAMMLEGMKVVQVSKRPRYQRHKI